jgi:hypothetical protein
MAEQNATFVMSITFLLRRDFGAIAKVAHSKGTHYFEIENNILAIPFFDYDSNSISMRMKLIM